MLQRGVANVLPPIEDHYATLGSGNSFTAQDIPMMPIIMVRNAIPVREIPPPTKIGMAVTRSARVPAAAAVATAVVATRVVNSYGGG